MGYVYVRIKEILTPIINDGNRDLIEELANEIDAYHLGEVDYYNKEISKLYEELDND